MYCNICGSYTGVMSEFGSICWFCQQIRNKNEDTLIKNQVVDKADFYPTWAQLEKKLKELK